MSQIIDVVKHYLEQNDLVTGKVDKISIIVETLNEHAHDSDTCQTILSKEYDYRCDETCEEKEREKKREKLKQKMSHMYGGIGNEIDKKENVYNDRKLMPGPNCLVKIGEHTYIRKNTGFVNDIKGKDHECGCDRSWNCKPRY